MSRKAVANGYVPEARSTEGTQKSAGAVSHPYLRQAGAGVIC